MARTQCICYSRVLELSATVTVGAIKSLKTKPNWYKLTENDTNNAQFYGKCHNPVTVIDTEL